MLLASFVIFAFGVINRERSEQISTNIANEMSK